MTTTPDFRALAQQLAEQLRHAMDFTISSETYGYMAASIERTNAALATPPPEPPSPYWPTKGEAIQLAMDTRLYRFQDTAGDPIQYEMTEAQLIAFARAVLERWGKSSQ